MKLIRLLIIIAFFFGGLYFRNEIHAIVTSGSPFNREMIKALVRCRFYSEEMAVLKNAKDRKMTVPLPPETTHFPDGTYLTTAAHFQKYLDITLADFGWTKVTRLNQTYTVRDKTGYKQFKIMDSSYVGVFRRLKFILE